MNEKTAVIFTGIQASGKTTFYKLYLRDHSHINLDTLHTRNKERLAIEECIEREESFVVDNTNPTKDDRAGYIGIAKENGYKIKGYYFSSSIKDCIARNREREGKANIPDTAIACTYNKLELPSYDEGFDELYYVRMNEGSFDIEEWEKEGQ